MKKQLYFAIAFEKDGKHFAMVETVPAYLNLRHAFPNKNISVIHYCDTKKEAFETAETWNNAYRENCTYSMEAAV